MRFLTTLVLALFVTADLHSQIKIIATVPDDGFNTWEGSSAIYCPDGTIWVSYPTGPKTGLIKSYDPYGKNISSYSFNGSYGTPSAGLWGVASMHYSTSERYFGGSGLFGGIYGLGGIYKLWNNGTFSKQEDFNTYWEVKGNQGFVMNDAGQYFVANNRNNSLVSWSKDSGYTQVTSVTGSPYINKPLVDQGDREAIWFNGLDYGGVLFPGHTNFTARYDGTGSISFFGDMSASTVYTAADGTIYLATSGTVQSSNPNIIIVNGPGNATISHYSSNGVLLDSAFTDQGTKLTNMVQTADGAVYALAEYPQDFQKFLAVKKVGSEIQVAHRFEPNLYGGGTKRLMKTPDGKIFGVGTYYPNSKSGKIAFFTFDKTFNACPVLLPDTVTLSQEKKTGKWSGSLNPLSNDYDCEKEALTFQSLSVPDNINATVTGSGKSLQVKFQTQSSDPEPFTMLYKVKDASGHSSEGTIYVVSPFTGTYQGTAGDVQGNVLLPLTIDSKNQISGKIILSGITYKISGTLDYDDYANLGVGAAGSLEVKAIRGATRQLYVRLKYNSRTLTGNLPRIK